MAHTRQRSCCLLFSRTQSNYFSFTSLVKELTNYVLWGQHDKRKKSFLIDVHIPWLVDGRLSSPPAPLCVGRGCASGITWQLQLLQMPKRAWVGPKSQPSLSLYKTGPQPWSCLYQWWGWGEYQVQSWGGKSGELALKESLSEGVTIFPLMLAL